MQRDGLLTAAEFAQKHLIRVRDVKRVLKRHKIGSVEDGIRHFREEEMLPLIQEKISRVRQQRLRILNKTVLVVDDDEANLDLVERTLRGHYKVFRAASGAEALATFQKEPIEVILCDQRMPGMTGTEFLTAATRINPDTIRILVSAYSDAAALTDAINTAKVHYFLPKPVSPEQLLGKVQEAFAEFERARHIQSILLGDSQGD